MAENAIKIKKIREAGKVIYPATILDAIKDANKTVDGKTNDNYGKTLRQILAAQAEGASEEVQELKDFLYGTPAVGNEGDEDYVPAVEGDIPAIQARLDVIEGDADVEGSIKKAAADAVAEVVADAPEAFDTLKEIAEWISKEDNEEAFDAAQRITNLETAVGKPSVAGTSHEATAEEAAAFNEENADAIAAGEKTAMQEGDTVIDTPAVEGDGLTKRIEDLEAVNNTRDLTTEDEAVDNQYVSSVAQAADGTITITREDLPVIGVNEDSENYASINEAHEIEIKTSTLGSVGLAKGEDGKYAAGEANDATGLAVAADVAAELVNDEEVIAAALNDHEERVLALESKVSDVALSAEDLSNADEAAVDYEDVF